MMDIYVRDLSTVTVPLHGYYDSPERTAQERTIAIFMIQAEWPWCHNCRATWRREGRIECPGCGQGDLI